MAMTLETAFSRRLRGRAIITNILRAIGTALYRAHRRRVTEKALSRLSDRDLEDIGLTRTAFGYALVPWRPDSSDWRYSEKK